MPPTTDRPDPAATGVPSRLEEEAHLLAAGLLGGSARWPHVQAVARRAVVAAPTVPPPDRPLLMAAAWLHDIGYAPALRRTGFHPLDGALYLREQQWPPVVVGLVAQHSGARIVAAERGLADRLDRLTPDGCVQGPLADALTFADQTSGPDGRLMDVDERLDDMLRRHGTDSPNGRVHERRAPAVRAAVRRTEQRLQRLGRPVADPVP
ncbi:HD domain-containing protein [Blastococcus sp. SYSU D00695]